MKTVQEWSDEFDTLVSSYRRLKDFDDKEILDSVEFNEYEKSIFLTKAQSEIVRELYSGKYTNDSFERTEDVRRYLEPLVRQKDYTVDDGVNTSDKLVDKYTHTVFDLPDDLQFIVYEQLKQQSSNTCMGGLVLDVYPCQHDEYVRITRNPFRGPNYKRAIRLDNSDKQVEIVTVNPVSSYIIRYLAYPQPIVLAQLPSESIDGVSTPQTCKLPEYLHRSILETAVRMALQTKVSDNKDNNK